MKALITTILIFTTLISLAQPFGSFRGTTKGVGVSLGFNEPRTNLEISGSMNTSISDDFDKPKVLWAGIGKTIYLRKDKERTAFSLTSSIGRVFIARKQISHTSGDPVDNNYKGWIFTQEINYNASEDVRWFIMGAFTDISYFGFGVKILANGLLNND